jgi:hypothetical protein
MKKKTPTPQATPVLDTKLYTIDEWKKLYGTPGGGNGIDINGRTSGYFPTEPDFCEDTIN